MILLESNIATLQYSSEDFHFNVSECNTECTFDHVLKEKWKMAENNGVLRYKLNIKSSKILEGQYRFLMQLNLDRGSNRRRPEHMTTMTQAFDPNRFNFTKLPPEEIIFDIGNGDGNNVLAVNVSPIESGHYLILTDRLKCLPQSITKHSLHKSIELFLLSNSPYLRLIFNSLCAHASVNHLHWHIYYLNHKMLLEDIELQHAAGPLFLLENFPSKGFCIKKSCTRNIDEFITYIFLIVHYLQQHEIAHNVYITRAKSVSSSESYDDIRGYVWARTSCHEVKDMHLFVPAVSELFGHLSIKNEQEYYSLTEEKVANILHEITSDVYSSVKNDLIQLVNEQLKKEQFLELHSTIN